MADLRRYRSLVMDSARWEGFPFRADDVIISTPPKCGTTWTQTLCAMLLLDTVELPRPLAELSPWLDMQTSSVVEVLSLLEAQEHRRFIKTHTPPDGLSVPEGVTLLFVGRDPRDVWLSWQNHMSNMDLDAILAARAAAVGLDDLPELGPPAPPPPDDLIARFRLWVDAGAAGTFGTELAPVVDHLRQAWDLQLAPHVHLFHYADLLADLPREVRRLAHALGLVIGEERLDDIVEAARFGAMKERADLLAPDVGHRIWKSNSEFFHRGTTGRWQAMLDDDALRRYDERVRSLAGDADLVTWLHHGSVAAELQPS